ncbi:MAG TPA: SurA N-terminal domain-containing protein [Burkholderiaceae bacterium]|nr:SurA N-terminal domain-containing protein [Burkholderiaceae bacterium]
MITAIRNLFSSAIGKFLALAFVVVVGLAFALSDVTGSGTFGGIAGATVAQVGDTEIGVGELRDRVRLAYNQARQDQPGMTMASFVESGGLDQVLNQLIEGAAFEQFAAKLGFGTSKRLVDGRIADLPVFAGVSGKFDQTRFQAFLRENGISEAQLRRDLRQQLFVEQLAAPIGTVARLAPGMAQPEHFDAPAGAEQSVSIAVPALRRGWQPAPRLRVETRFPLGIWRAWSWWQPALRLLVYPQPEPPGVPLPARQASAGEGLANGRGEQDLAALRPWQEGDSPRRVAWKAMARTATDELIVRQYEGGDLGELSLDWDQLPGNWDAEQRLSRLTRWVLEADSIGARYALRIPGTTLSTDAGPAHRARCLEALATWGLDDGTPAAAAAAPTAAVPTADAEPGR